MADNPCRNAGPYGVGRRVLAHDRIGADNCTVSQGDGAKNLGPWRQINSVAEFGDTPFSTSFANTKGYTLGNVAIITDMDIRPDDDLAEMSNIKPFANFYRWWDIDACSHLNEFPPKLIEGPHNLSERSFKTHVMDAVSNSIANEGPNTLVVEDKPRQASIIAEGIVARNVGFYSVKHFNSQEVLADGWFI